MNIEQLHIGMTVVEVSPFGRETIPMQVVGIFKMARYTLILKATRETCGKQTLRT